MTEPYAIHGRVVRSNGANGSQPSISFELMFPEDWVLLEKQLNVASFGFAQLRLDALNLDALDSIEQSAIPEPTSLAPLSIMFPSQWIA